MKPSIGLVAVGPAVVFLVVLAGIGRAAAEREGLPALGPATMAIPWSEFKVLLERLEALEKEAVPPAPLPPVDWTIAGARYTAQVVDAASVRVAAEMDIRILKPDGWVQVPVTRDSVAPTSALLDGEDTPLALAGDGWLSVVLDKPGDHRFAMTFFASCVQGEGVVSFEFPCPRTPLTHLSLEIPVPDATIDAPKARNIAVRRAAESLTAQLAFQGTEEISVSWTLPAVLEKRKPEEARVSCVASTLASLTDRYVTCTTHLRFDMLRGGADLFRLRLPGAVNVLEVAGSGAAWSASESPEGQEIEVKVNHRVEDGYELVVKYESAFDAETGTVEVPELTVLDVVRQTGFIGVTARMNAEVAPNPEIRGATRIDISELPAAVRTMSPNPLLLGYKYADDGYFLALDVRRLEDVPVRVASIDRAALVTMITEEGIAVTRAHYEVRNNIKQFLRIDVPEGAEVWTTEVGGQPVKPARDDAPSAVLIPLFKSAETACRLNVFPVELVYMERVAKVSRFGGAVNLEAPAADILSNEIEWEVLIPETQRLWRTKGDLDPLVWKAGRGVALPAALRAGVRTQEQTIRRLGNGVERFFITDINNPAGSAASGPPRYTGAPLPKEPAGPTNVQVAGVLPVHIQLPAEGVAHQFRRLIVPEGQPLGLTLYFYNSRLASGFETGLALVAILTGVMFARLIWHSALRRRLDRKKFGMVLGGMVFFLVPAILSGVSYVPAIKWGMAAFVVTMALHGAAELLARRPLSGIKKIWAKQGE